MAESLALTESGPLKPEEISEGETLDSDPDTEASRKRGRPSTDSPSPCGEKPPQPQRFKGLNKVPYPDSEPTVPPSVEKLALKSQVSNSPFLKNSGHAMTLEPAPKGVKPYRDYLDRDYEKQKDPCVQPLAAHSRSLTLWVILMNPAVLPPPLG